MESTKLAEAKYQKAIELIQQAADLLSEACGELSPLVGACEHWTDVGNHYDQIRALSRRLMYSSARHNVVMDEE